MWPLRAVSKAEYLPIVLLACGILGRRRTARARKRSH